MALLEVDGLGISFGGLRALDDVSVKVDEWEIVGLIGPNGAGKTTFFNCVTGFYAPDSGSIRFKDQDVSHLAPHKRVALGMGRTFQQIGLVRGLTVLENLMIAQHEHVAYDVLSGVLGFPGSFTEDARLRRIGRDILAVVGLDDYRDDVVDDLAYGTLKMVEMATVLATDPDILMLDEPSSGMGPEESDQLGETLLRLRSELEITILMIEHHVPLVVRACDYVYCLNFGQLLAEGKPDAVKNHPEVVAAYLGEEAARAS